jgi:hypothetical protein
MANSEDVNDKLARGQLHRLVRRWLGYDDDVVNEIAAQVEPPPPPVVYGASGTKIMTPIRFTQLGWSVIGLPPRLDTEDVRRLIDRVNEFQTLSPEDATKLLDLLCEPDVFGMLV